MVRTTAANKLDVSGNASTFAETSNLFVSTSHSLLSRHVRHPFCCHLRLHSFLFSSLPPLSHIYLIDPRAATLPGGVAFPSPPDSSLICCCEAAAVSDRSRPRALIRDHDGRRIDTRQDGRVQVCACASAATPGPEQSWRATAIAIDGRAKGRREPRWPPEEIRVRPPSGADWEGDLGDHGKTREAGAA